MAKYQQYEEYKESGIEWVEEIPKSWSSVSLRWISTIYSGGTPSKTNLSYWEDGTIPWLNSGTVNQGLIVDPSTYITNDALQNSSAKWIPKGSLVLALAGQGKTKGMVAQTGIDTTCNQSMAAIVFNEKKFARFIFWWLTSNYQNIRNMAGGDLRDGLNLEHLGSIQCPQPSIDEAIKITGFLDHETAQIDTLIDKQQALIQLLKEKRQAVISHAVTKGLNPDAPMKDSGVEWLGEVPEHWVVSPLKLYIDTRKGVAFKSADFTDLGVRVVKASDIKEKTIRQSDVFLPVYFSETYPKAILSEGDIVISTVGSTPDVKNSAVGQIGMVPVELDGSLLNQNTVVFTPRNNMLENLFLFYLIQTDVYRDHLDLNAHGTANQASLNVSDMLNFTFARPSFKEQSEISEHIIEVNSSFDALERNCLTAIQLMQERRTALISAAVTGKIDVRDWELLKK